ncbi:hypothetical protein TWF225_004493 [Orbilia oligospora]|nr:hypothetical protein TWF225_004493 [Orbilia oligospora]KAF3243528.1 hypothetical protein TWF128_010240 [Orbilia oligospora]
MRERAYTNAATRAFDKASIDDLTTDSIAAFNITGRDTPDPPGSESYPETTWQILSDDAAPVIWPLEKLTKGTSTNEKVEDFCRIVNAALETSGLSISASFAAMLYVTLLSDDPGLKSAVDNSLELIVHFHTAPKEMYLNFQSHGKSCLSGSSGLCQRLRRDAVKHPFISRGKMAYSIGQRATDTHKFEFWRFLAILVGEECMLKIRAYVIGDSENGALINRLENCICLSSDLHALFNDGCFILEPLGEDERSLMRVDVSKFCESAVPAEYSVRYTKVAGLVEPLVRRGSGIHNLSVNDIPASDLEDDAILAFNSVYDVVQKRELQHGEIIRFKTDNPDTHPLPYPHLLWPHTNIGQVVRMAGRTGEYEYASEFDAELEEEEL